jgi:hypothetical protein
MVGIGDGADGAATHCHGCGRPLAACAGSCGRGGAGDPMRFCPGCGARLREIVVVPGVHGRWCGTHGVVESEG